MSDRTALANARLWSASSDMREALITALETIADEIQLLEAWAPEALLPTSDDMRERAKGLRARLEQFRAVLKKASSE